MTTESKDIREDRELLELAGKAAGYEGVRPATFGMDCWMAMSEGEWLPWNPLTDDGDALRLAVKLGLTLEFCERRVLATYPSGVDEFDFVDEKYGDDKTMATRRAIVRAAAEIGRQA